MVLPMASKAEGRGFNPGAEIHLNFTTSFTVSRETEEICINLRSKSVNIASKWVLTSYYKNSKIEVNVVPSVWLSNKMIFASELVLTVIFLIKDNCRCSCRNCKTRA